MFFISFYGCAFSFLTDFIVAFANVFYLHYVNLILAWCDRCTHTHYVLQHFLHVLCCSNLCKSTCCSTYISSNSNMIHSRFTWSFSMMQTHQCTCSNTDLSVFLLRLPLCCWLPVHCCPTSTSGAHSVLSLLSAQPHGDREPTYFRSVHIDIYFVSAPSESVFV